MIFDGESVVKALEFKARVRRVLEDTLSDDRVSAPPGIGMLGVSVSPLMVPDGICKYHRVQLVGG